MMIGQTLWTEFFANRDWPVASAVAVVLLCLWSCRSWSTSRCRRAISRGGADRAQSILVQHRLGGARAGLPLPADRHLVIYSFNASRLVTVWGGWSTRWYAALLNDAPCSTPPG
jgi:hypothetical protein